MTGLNPSKDTILSISCILTTSDLFPLDPEGFNAVIYHTPEELAQMSEWCIKTHGDSGLTQECLSSSITANVASTQLLSYIKHYIPEPRRALLAGNSIHADRAFLMVPPWDIVLEHLHYRLFDVSAMKEMVRRWASDQVLMAAPRKELRHTAREDVLESIQEAQFYKALIERVAPVPVPFGLSAAATGDGENVDANGRTIMPPLSAASMPSYPPPSMMLGGGVGTKHGQGQGQEAPGTLLRNNGTRTGDVGTLDPGFRTDIP
ncbi:putative oligoribonuclease [Cladophialophora carrionii]|uniref:Putative oligoribonuclease n=1 Tax=Cladophialophora carrionii TaxID=86049 RepID=A0A1C1CEK5_9EURO|nr:putative oligoribonuclease [Cladophialophora carrionii]